MTTLGKLNQHVPTAKDVVVGLQIRRVLALYSLELSGRHLNVQSGDNTPCHFILYGKNVRYFAIEPFRSKMRARFGFDELGGDTHASIVTADASFENVADPKISPDILNIHRLAFVNEG